MESHITHTHMPPLHMKGELHLTTFPNYKIQVHSSWSLVGLKQFKIINKDDHIHFKFNASIIKLPFEGENVLTRVNGITL
jgi:hypothetical protein